jgi:hypothetical protein
MSLDYRRNYVIEIVTPAGTFRWTPSRARTRDGRIGIILAGLYYGKMIVEVPSIEISAEASAPADVNILIGNAEGAADELVFDSSVLGDQSTVRITRVNFGEQWEQVGTDGWFTGHIGNASLSDETVTISCYNDAGRRRGSGARKSQTLMLSHAPLSRGAKVGIIG